MAAITWERFDEQVARRAPLRLVTAPPSRRRPDAGVYRRRRLVAAVLVLALAAAVVGAARLALTSSATAGQAPAAAVVLVAQPGDSYWSLAGQVHDDGDLRSTVDALVDANGGRDLRAGDRIVFGQ